MSETSKPGPVIAEAVEEVQGIFPSDAALQNAIALLTREGFDRADLSLPDAHPIRSANTPNEGAENPNTEDDARQSRTLHARMAASTAALAGAGAVVLTGGAALPAAAAAVGAGLAAGGAAEAVATAANRAEHELREEAAARGELPKTNCPVSRRNVYAPRGLRN
jgi:hypothetical protein